MNNKSSVLTEQEWHLLNQLGECQGLFQQIEQLDTIHPADLGDFTFHIHALQNIVMSRAAMRELRGAGVEQYQKRDDSQQEKP